MDALWSVHPRHAERVEQFWRSYHRGVKTLVMLLVVLAVYMAVAMALRFGWGVECRFVWLFAIGYAVGLGWEAHLYTL